MLYKTAITAAEITKTSNARIDSTYCVKIKADNNKIEQMRIDFKSYLMTKYFFAWNTLIRNNTK